MSGLMSFAARLGGAAARAAGAGRLRDDAGPAGGGAAEPGGAGDVRAEGRGGVRRAGDPGANLTPENVRREVDFWADEPPGSIVVDPYAHYLYYVLGYDRAIRYRVGVGEAGRTFAGRATVRRKVEWPGWTPTANMIRREPELYGPWAGGMEPGLENPLGARAMYLYRGGRDTMYRIHGTYAPSSIGVSVSAGCIRMFQQDAMDLYERVGLGTPVRVLAPHETGFGTVPRGYYAAYSG